MEAPPPGDVGEAWDDPGESVTPADVVADAFDLLRSEPIAMVPTAIGSFLSQIPTVGSFLNVFISGFVVDFLASERGHTERSSGLGMRLASLFFGSLAAGLAILVGVLLLVLPGIYLALKFSLITPAVMVGSNGPLEALGESFDRTSGHLPTVFTVSLVAVGPVLVVLAAIYASMGLETVVEMTRLQRPGLLVAFVVLTTPFATFGYCGQVVMYERF